MTIVTLHPLPWDLVIVRLGGVTIEILILQVRKEYLMRFLYVDGV